MERARAAFRELGLTEGATTADAVERVSVIVDLHECLRRLDVRVFGGPPGALAAALAPAESLLSRVWATMTDSGYRETLRQVRAFSADPNRSPADLLEEVLKADELRTRWLRIAIPGSTPRALGADPAVLQSEISTFARAVTDFSRFFAGVDGLTMTVAGLHEWTDALAADALTPFRVARIRQIKAGLRAIGAGEFVDDICAAVPPPSTWSTPVRLRVAEILPGCRLR